MSKNHPKEIMAMRARHKTPEEAQRAHEEWQRQNDANQREQEAARRELFSRFKMWKACPGKACQRGRACRGDVELCLRERWQPLVPPRLKAVLQKTFEFAAQGDMTLPEAIAAAQADIARRDAAAARAAAPKPVVPIAGAAGVDSGAPPQPIKMPPRVRKHPRGPRIRSLS